MEMPSISFGISEPASSAKVGSMSQKAETCELRVPPGMVPGQWATIGTLMPPSYRCLFLPRKGPELLKNFGWAPPSAWGPLSLVKITRVFLSIFNFFRCAMMRPMSRSIRVIIAANFSSPGATACHGIPQVPGSGVPRGVSCRRGREK